MMERPEHRQTGADFSQAQLRQALPQPMGQFIG